MDIEHLDDTWISQDGDDLLGVQVNAEDPTHHAVFVNVMEFLRTEPTESRVRAAIADALRAVEGVDEVVEEDRETWVVSGAASGDALIRAAAATLDGLSAELAEHVDRPDDPGI